MSTENLFQPIQLGDIELKHRVVMAPLTRRRADSQGVPSQYAPEYYAQRAQFPGTLIIAEAVPVSPKVAPLFAVPQISTPPQISRWKEITDAVHSQNSYIFAQLWALGKSNPNIKVEAADLSTKYDTDEGKELRQKSVNDLTLDEIQSLINWYGDSAAIAMEKAGFDGIEIHGANGYLIEQFIRESSNQRTDKYGGSIENRTRFAREVLDAVVNRVGGNAAKVGFRISPWSRSGGGLSRPSEATVAEYSYLLSYFQKEYPNLAYVSIVEPRLANGHADNAAVPSIAGLELDEWNLFVRLVWKGLIIRAGGIVHEGIAQRLAAKDPKVLIAVGRYFISNPDLVYRLMNGKELQKYDRSTFYTPGPKGYIDYANSN